MTCILIDSRHLGDALCIVRRRLNLSRDRAAIIMGVSRQEYRSYELGRTLIPHEMLQRLFHHSLVGLNTKYVMNNIKKRI